MPLLVSQCPNRDDRVEDITQQQWTQERANNALLYDRLRSEEFACGTENEVVHDAQQRADMRQLRDGDDCCAGQWVGRRSVCGPWSLHIMRLRPPRVRGAGVGSNIRSHLPSLGR
jgi:hypothetical protein